MTWTWRGEFFPARRDDFSMIWHALGQENISPTKPGGPPQRFADLADAERTALMHKRLGDYMRKVYKKTRVTKVEVRTGTRRGRRTWTALISTARRLAELLGDQMGEDKGLACKFIISQKPVGAPVTERAVPVATLAAKESAKRTYLRKWLKDNSLANLELRKLLDWDYYIGRLGFVIQKLVTIPAAMQKMPNPMPRIRHLD
jgi:hypothetical protein